MPEGRSTNSDSKRLLVLYATDVGSRRLDRDIDIVKRLTADRPGLEVLALSSRGQRSAFRRAGCRTIDFPNQRKSDPDFARALVEEHEPDLLVVRGRAGAALTSVMGPYPGGSTVPAILLMEKWPRAGDPLRESLEKASRILFFGSANPSKRRPYPSRGFIRAQDDTQSIADEISSTLDDRRPLARFAHRIIVKFTERLNFTPETWRRGVMTSLAEAGAPAQDIAALEELLLRPLITSVSPLRLQAPIQRARKLDPAYSPPNFFSYFVGALPSQFGDPYEFARQLSRLPSVDRAYVDPEASGPSAPGNVTPGDGNEQPQYAHQGYLGPQGINVEAVWPRLGGAGAGGSGYLGADGQGQTFGLVERDWGPSHVDLDDVSPGYSRLTRINGSNDVYDEPQYHGTRTLGVVCAMDNTVGCIGVAPHIDAGQLSGVFGSDRRNAIIAAVSSLSFGDVLLIELELRNYLDPSTGIIWDKVPVELAEADNLVVELAAVSQVVIEPAGNGGHNLDQYHTEDPGRPGVQLHVLDPDSPDFRDSKAIMVGASNSPHVARPGRTGTHSNYGCRVDCHAWGNSVVTTDWVAPAPSTATTSLVGGYDGTSAASAIIAGAAVALQGIAEQNLGRRLSPAEMRALLSDPTIGTLSLDHNNANLPRPIGVMPDLARVVNLPALSLAPDIYIRDHVGDSGDPTTGNVSASPDIFVRGAQVANPTARFGPGNLNASGVLPGDVSGPGDDWIYVRVSNRGGSTAHDVVARVYWARPSTLADPSTWNLLGETRLWHGVGRNQPTSTVFASEALAVSEPIRWRNAGVNPGPGHYCFVALIESSGDPLPTPSVLGDYAAYLRFIRENNNVAWRNFNIVATATRNHPFVVPPQFSGDASVAAPMQFFARGAPDRPRRMQLEIAGALPPRTGLWAGLPPAMAAEIGATVGEPLAAEDGRVWIPMNPRGRVVVHDAIFARSVQYDVRLWASVPDELEDAPYQVYARQIEAGEEVGRVTWEIVSSRTLRRRRSI
jgi:hypothetical protein